MQNEAQKLSQASAAAQAQAQLLANATRFQADLRAIQAQAHTAATAIKTDTGTI